MSTADVTQAFNEWFDTHYAEWLRVMRSVSNFAAIKDLRSSSLVAWEAGRKSLRSSKEGA